MYRCQGPDGVIRKVTATEATPVCPVVQNAGPKFNSEALVVFPNPSDGRFTVFWEDEDALDYDLPTNISISSIQGRRIFEANNITFPLHIDLMGIKRGVYYLHLYNGTNLVTRKLIIR